MKPYIWNYSKIKIPGKNYNQDARFLLIILSTKYYFTIENLNDSQAST